MTRSSCAFAFLIALTLTVSSATPRLSLAATITWRFEATIREVQATASTTTGVIAPIDAIVSSLGATQGASVIGFVTFDSETPDLLSEATNSRFALLDASVSFSNWALTMTPPSAVSLSFLDVVSYPDLGGSAVVAVADAVDPSATFERGFFSLQFTSTDPGRLGRPVRLSEPALRVGDRAVHRRSRSDRVRLGDRGADVGRARARSHSARAARARERRVAGAHPAPLLKYPRGS